MSLSEEKGNLVYQRMQQTKILFGMCFLLPILLVSESHLWFNLMLLVLLSAASGYSWSSSYIDDTERRLDQKEYQKLRRQK